MSQIPKQIPKPIPDLISKLKTTKRIIEKDIGLKKLKEAEVQKQPRREQIIRDSLLKEFTNILENEEIKPGAKLVYLPGVEKQYRKQFHVVGGNEFKIDMTDPIQRSIVKPVLKN